MDDESGGGVLEEARAARDAGSAWRARDLLAAHVEAHRDPEALALLAEVLHDMGDLPRAGAMWFAAGAQGPDVDAAVAAWRAQAGDDFGAMWRSLPASVRAEPRPRRIEALRERALAAGSEEEEAVWARPGGEPDGELGVPGRAERAEVSERSTTSEEADDDGFDAAWLVAWILAAAFVVFAVIGFITVLAWLVPG
jgi:hypothetical protein